MGPSTEAFLTYLMSPPRERGEQQADEWSEALDQLDGIA
jgi:hypothetical protein